MFKRITENEYYQFEFLGAGAASMRDGGVIPMLGVMLDDGITLKFEKQE